MYAHMSVKYALGMWTGQKISHREEINMKNTIKIYLSGPVTGTKDYIERFAEAERTLTAAGQVIVNPVKVNAGLPEETTYAEYMKVSIAMLDICQGIYMMENWQDSKGATVEFERAYETKKTIFFEER